MTDLSRESLEQWRSELAGVSGDVWEGRYAPNLPAEPLTFGVISYATGKEVCRVWSREDLDHLRRCDPATIGALIDAHIAAAELARRVEDVLSTLGPGGYLLPAGAAKTNTLEAALNEFRALNPKEPKNG